MRQVRDILLQILHTKTENDKNYFRVINLESGNSAPEAELISPFSLKIAGASDAKFMPRLQWYLENYLSMPIDVNVGVANDVEKTIKSWGLDCFSRLFTGNASIWFKKCLAKDGLRNLKLEIASDEPSVHGWLWEALYSPDFGYLAQQCHIERRLPGKYELPGITVSNKALNILYIIARPKDEAYVGYSTLLRPLLNYLPDINKNVNIDLLRPPTFEKLKQQLKDKPGYYNIIHFDGHGNYGDKSALPMKDAFLAEGMLAFEDNKGKSSSIEADAIATLLLEHKIPIMILNACRSGMIDENAADPFSSVAAALLKAGVRSVTAMSYSLYVSGAKQFVPAMYRELFSSGSIAEAVRAGRQSMFLHKKRTTFLGEIELNDWLVPVVYQQTENKERLLPKLKNGGRKASIPLSNDFDFDSYGFIGRERYVYILEGVLQRNGQPAILINGMSGVGKTTFAKGFIHWLAQTGGLSNEPVWISFEGVADVQIQFDILTKNLLSSEVMFLDTDGRFQALIEALKKIPRFIVFDNLETATNETYITNAETFQKNRKLISKFLKALHSGKTKIIMTSRLPENWLPTEYCYTLEMGGFEGEELWEFCSRVLRNLDLDFDGKNETYQKFVSEILGGNPVAIRTILLCMKHGTALETVMEEYTTGYNWLEEEKNNEYEKDEYTRRVRVSYGVLKSRIDSRFVPVLEILALYEQYALINQIVPMLEKQNVDEHTVIDCLKLIESAGLCTDKGDGLYQLHPALAQCLKREYSPDEQTERIFTEMFTFLAQELHKKPLDVRNANTIFSANMEKALKLAKVNEMIECEGVITNYFANFCYNLRQFSKAAEWYGLLIEIHERRGDEDGVSTAYHMLGNVALDRKDFKAAEKWYNECLDIRLKLNVAEDIAGINHQLGMLALEQHDFRTAEEWYNKSFEILPDSAKDENAAIYHEFGRIAQERRDFTTAEKWFNKSLDIALKNGNELIAAQAYLHLGINAVEQRDYETANKMYASSKRILIKLGDKYGLSKVYYELGLIDKEKGDFPTAEKYFNKSLEMDIKLGDDSGSAKVYSALGGLAEKQNDLAGAENWYNKSLEVRKKSNNIHDIANAYNNLGIIARKRREFETAEKLCTKSLELFTLLNHDNDMACVCHSLGEIAQDRNNFADAKKWYEKSLEIDLHLGNDYEAEETRLQLRQLYSSSENYSEDTLVQSLYLLLDSGNIEMLEQNIKQTGELISKHPQHKQGLDRFISYFMDKEHNKKYNTSITMLMDIMNGELSETAKKSVINKAERIIRDGNMDKKMGNMQAAYRAYSSAGYLFIKIQYKEGVTGAMRCTGILYEECNNLEAALDFYQKALGYTDYDCRQKAFTLAQLGMYYKRRGLTPKALEYTIDALNMFISLNDEESVSICKKQLKELKEQS